MFGRILKRKERTQIEREWGGGKRGGEMKKEKKQRAGKFKVNVERTKR